MQINAVKIKTDMSKGKRGQSLNVHKGNEGHELSEKKNIKYRQFGVPFVLQET